MWGWALSSEKCSKVLLRHIAARTEISETGRTQKLSSESVFLSVTGSDESIQWIELVGYEYTAKLGEILFTP